MISGRSAQAAARMAKANEISGHSHAGSVSADFVSLGGGLSYAYAGDTSTIVSTMCAELTRVSRSR